MRIRVACLIGAELKLDVLDDGVPLYARKSASCFQYVTV